MKDLRIRRLTVHQYKWTRRGPTGDYSGEIARQFVQTSDWRIAPIRGVPVTFQRDATEGLRKLTALGPKSEKRDGRGE